MATLLSCNATMHAFADRQRLVVTTLVDQPRGKELEYRAVAVNKAGDGEPSNTVMAVL